MDHKMSALDLDFYLRQIEKVAEGGYPAPMTFDGWVTTVKVLESNAYTSVESIKYMLREAIQAAAIIQSGCTASEFAHAVQEKEAGVISLDAPIRVGDDVYYVPRDKRWDSPSYKTVTKVGRKWIYCGDRFRFDKNSMLVDGGNYSSPGKIYRHAGFYEQKLRHDRKYRAICKTFDPYSRSDWLNEDQLDKVIEVLGIDVEATLDGGSK